MTAVKHHSEKILTDCQFMNATIEQLCQIMIFSKLQRDRLEQMREQQLLQFAIPAELQYLQIVSNKLTRRGIDCSRAGCGTRRCNSTKCIKLS
jgi:hypothetical protein